MYDPDDTDLVVFLASAGGCSLASKAGDKDNWIERTGPGGRGGSLPNYVCKIAKGVMKSGKSKSQAISIAIGQIKKWAKGGDDVDADTRAKAAKALAQWNALKAKNKAKRLVKASHVDDGTPYLFLSQEGMDEFDTDVVRRAWEALMSEARRRAWEREEKSSHDGPVEAVPYTYIKSLWTTFIIVESERNGALTKIPYTVTGNQVSFGQPEAVKIDYKTVGTWDEAWDEAIIETSADDEDTLTLTENEKALLGLSGV